jgi:hypothetical protein
MNKKEKLIEALEKERQRFVDGGHSTLDHDVAIEYLKTGKTDKNPDNYEMLDAVMHDFDCVCSDYDIA